MEKKEKKKNNEQLVYEYQNAQTEAEQKKIAQELYLKIEKLIYKMVNTIQQKFYIHQFVQEEILLEANCIFMKCIKKFNTTKKIKFSTYLCDALWYELKRYVKKQMKHMNNTYDLEIDEILKAKSFDVDGVIDDTDNINKIKRILVKLREEDQITDKQFHTMIEEHGFFGETRMSRREMAEKRGCTLQNIGFLYRKAVNRIKEEIEKENLEYDLHNTIKEI